MSGDIPTDEKIPRSYIRRLPPLAMKYDSLRLKHIVPETRSRKSVSLDRATVTLGEIMDTYLKLKEMTANYASSLDDESLEEKSRTNKESQEFKLRSTRASAEARNHFWGVQNGIEKEKSKNAPRLTQADPVVDEISHGRNESSVVDPTVREAEVTNKEVGRDRSKPREKTSQEGFYQFPWNGSSPASRYKQYMQIPREFSNVYADALYYKLEASRNRVGSPTRPPNVFEFGANPTKNQNPVPVTKTIKENPELVVKSHPVPVTKTIKENPELVVKSVPGNQSQSDSSKTECPKP